MSCRNATRSLKAKLHRSHRGPFWSRCLNSGSASRESSRNVPVLHIPSASIFRFSASNTSNPVLNLDWIIHEGDSWVIVGDAGEAKLTLLETLKGQSRIIPPPPNGVWPFLFKKGLDPIEYVRSVSFAQRPRAVTGGGFYDYSARYGAVREEDRVTLHQYLLESLDSDKKNTVVQVAESLELKRYLDLPLVALSNGQTRRARIVRALLHKPKVLLLDEPLTGLDVHHRPRLVSLLRSLHKASAPHIIMSLRIQDPVPDWVSHIAFVRPGGQVSTGPKELFLQELEDYIVRHAPHPLTDTLATLKSNVPNSQRAVLVDLQGVNVSYHERHVLRDITWCIREGERWLLRGPNGSGKTTLLSLITGDVRYPPLLTPILLNTQLLWQHPQSFTQNHLHLFGAHRKRMATPEIARCIGISSPEIFNAFPRRSGPQGLTVRDAIATGFDGIFTYRKPTAKQASRVQSLLEDLGPTAWSETQDPSITTVFGGRLFADLTPGEQSLVILLRALVTEPKLLILDEAFSGMDERMIQIVTKYLRGRIGEKQSVIWISHWDAEAPWGAQDGVLTYTLQGR